MSDKKPTFEELVTEMGMDPALVKSMVQHLQVGNEQEAVWQAWCTPLIAQARRIEGIVNDCPVHNTKDTPHSLNRPGIYVSLPQYGSNPHLQIRVQNVDGLSVKCEPGKGVYLYNHLARRTDTGAICGSTEVYAHLEKSWYEQSALLQENWKTVFGHAPAILDAAEYSLANGTPLATTEPWERVLLAELERQHKNEIQPNTWRRWV